MHVAIVGAGALGRVYGVRLAAAGTDVTFVVRPSRASDRSAFRIVRVDGDGRQDDLAEPRLSASVPAADAILVCVRAEQVDAALEGTLGASGDAPVVMLTPLMPAALDALGRALGPRVVAAMPGVVAYVKTGTGGEVTRYWLPRVAPTLIDETSPQDPRVGALVDALASAQLPARLEPGVRETNPATTVAFIPLAMALDVAGGSDALLADKALLELALAATREGMALSRRIGKSAAWAGLLTRFVGPRTLRIGLALARSRSPEAVAYVEEHFGHKLHGQNVAMAEAMIKLAREKETPHDALDRLLGRLSGGR
jgi:2-dehydropantoate 2-reductase